MQRIYDRSVASRSATARTLGTTVHRRRFRLPPAGSDAMFYALLLNRGIGRIVRVDGSLPLDLEGPAAAAVAMETQVLLELEPGASGHLIGASDDVLSHAVGSHRDAVHLRSLISGNLAVSVQRGQGHWSNLTTAFAGIAREIEKAEDGSQAMLAAWLGVVLVSLWRLSGAARRTGDGASDVPLVMRRFRQQVEMHFREHWKIRRYADELGLTHDRLHAICRRTVGKPPLQLVHERLVYEGQLLLERSGFTVQQIGHALGFHDPTHFSRFFRNKTGVSPKNYRLSHMRRPERRSGSEPASFADWP
ncbi:MAG: helix-turn-helix domain-containing protein [Rhodospirillaceae bacterium]|nr:helix-turn-helix domain-containing protein [Rhodospirillaceae bacterium]